MKSIIICHDICSSSSGDRRSRHAHPHITLMISMKDAVRVFLRKPRAAPCRERGKHIRRGYDTAPFSRRTTSSGIAFSLKDVCLSRALIRGLSRGTLFPVGVVTTTANERYAVCVHTTTHERKNPICAVFAVLQAASSQEQYRPIHVFWRHPGPSLPVHSLLYYELRGITCTVQWLPVGLDEVHTIRGELVSRKQALSKRKW